MLRFTTNAKTLSGLQDPERLRDLNGQFAGEEGATTASIVGVEHRHDTDPSTTHGVFVREGDALERSLSHMMAILTADPHLSVSSYDRIQISPQIWKDGWRLYDFAKRGPMWLEHTVEEASRLAGGPPPKKLSPEDTHDFAKATMNRRSVRPDRHGKGVLHMMVQCRDRPGLFIDVDRAVDRVRARMRLNDGAGNISACFRIVGGQAFMLSASEQPTADAGQVENEMKHELGLLEPRDGAPRAMTLGGTAQRRSSPEPEVRVTRGAFGSSARATEGAHGFLSLYFEASERGLLDVFRAADQAAGMASVYYLDARIRRRSAIDANATLGCAIAWDVPLNSRPALRLGVSAALDALGSDVRRRVWSRHWN
ncbi:MAG: hypothetical protein U0638_12630 [Phycisphaerales bacterium]